MALARTSRLVGRAAAGEDRRFLGAAVATAFGKSQAASEQVYLAMISRGYSGEARTLSTWRLRRLDVVWTLAVLGGARRSACWFALVAGPADDGRRAAGERRPSVDAGRSSVERGRACADRARPPVDGDHLSPDRRLVPRTPLGSRRSPASILRSTRASASPSWALTALASPRSSRSSPASSNPLRAKVEAFGERVERRRPCRRRGDRASTFGAASGWCSRAPMPSSSTRRCATRSPSGRCTSTCRATRSWRVSTTPCGMLGSDRAGRARALQPERRREEEGRPGLGALHRPRRPAARRAHERPRPAHPGVASGAARAAA